MSRSNDSRDETEFGAFGDRFGAASVAASSDFLTGGGTLAASTSKAPPPPKGYVPGARQAEYDRGIASAALVARNRQYTGIRAGQDRTAIAASNAHAAAPMQHAGSGAWNFAGQDWGLLPAAGAVLATVAAPYALPAIAAAAGPLVAAAAPVLAAAGPIIKTIKTSPAAAATVKAADNLLATADTATAAGVKARAVLNDTIKASAAGNPKATEGLAVLSVVATDRAVQGVPAGVAGRAAFAPDQILTPLRAAPAVRAAAAPPPSVFTTVKLSDAETAAALASLGAAAAAAPSDPRYLVLDSGQVLSSALARQQLPGWVVRFDGRVVRQ